MREQIQKAKKALERLADRNGDEQFDSSDVAIIGAALEARANDATRAHPTAALVGAAIAGAIIGGALVHTVGKLFGC